MKKLHRILFWLPFGAEGLSLLGFLIALTRLPETIGVHFDPNGLFDVYDSKFYGFYPHVINVLVLAFTALFDCAVRKVKLTRKPALSENRENKIRQAVQLWLDWGRLLIVAFFCYWNVLVITQTPLLTAVPVTIVSLMMAGMIALIAAVITIIFARRSSC
ncbi:MAG: hypothetical protein II916_10705 [Oscillospiraceae bacterium]|nr:hypothetical protein [Oscillospiraceae bacterium]